MCILFTLCVHCEYLVLARDLDLEGLPGAQGDVQLVPGEADDREPELTLSYSHNDDYLTYHHRTFIWRWMEIESETHTGAPD